MVESHGEDDACGRGSLLLLVRLPAHGPAAMASMADLAVDLDSARVVVALAHGPGGAGSLRPPGERRASCQKTEVANYKIHMEQEVQEC